MIFRKSGPGMRDWEKRLGSRHCNP